MCAGGDRLLPNSKSADKGVEAEQGMVTCHHSLQRFFVNMRAGRLDDGVAHPQSARARILGQGEETAAELRGKTVIGAEMVALAAGGDDEHDL
eukprot:1159227-Pelagomonas_calceolata.AAC.19